MAGRLFTTTLAKVNPEPLGLRLDASNLPRSTGGSYVDRRPPTVGIRTRWAIFADTFVAEEQPAAVDFGANRPEQSCENGADRH